MVRKCLSGSHTPSFPLTSYFKAELAKLLRLTLNSRLALSEQDPPASVSPVQSSPLP